MDFSHTDDRRMLADTLGRFIADRYPIGLRNRAAYEAPGYSPTAWQGFAELGAIGALFGPEAGGYGGEAADIMVVFEALGAGAVVEPFLAALMSGQVLIATGDPQSLLPRIIAGQAIVAFAHYEPGARYDIDHVETRATLEGDQWRIHGAKAVVSHGEAAQQLIVSARTQGEIRDSAGLSLFLVPAKAAGVEMRTYTGLDGARAAELRLDDVRVPKDARLVGMAEASAIIEQVAAWGLLALCAEALGAMDVVKEMTLEYLRTRKQFGTPIGSFQVLQHRMAKLLIEVEQARSSVINAVQHFDASRGERERWLSAAKVTIGQVGTLVAEEAIQMHGGIGMTWELGLSHYAKRLILIDHYLGDVDHHLERYIALGRAA